MPLDSLTQSFSTVFTLVGIIGFTTNLLVIIPNIRHVANIAPSSFLVFWLCLFDIVAIVNGGFVSALNLATGDIRYDAKSCRFHAAVAMFGSISSILLCFGLTLFRYLIVVHQRDLPKNFTTFYVMGVVVFSAVVSLLPFMMGSQDQIYILRSSKAHCAPDWSQRDVQSSVLIWICFSIATMTLCFVVYAYAAMAATVVQVFAGVKTVGSAKSKPVKDRQSWVLTDKTERMSRTYQASYSAPTQEGSNTSSHISSPKSSLTGDAQNVMKLDKRQRDLMKQSIVVVVAFMIGWTPYLCS
ncbi:hypothetical protein CcCBS67573_g08810 [Chytriomyces confervae]|uniref:G-protein coupled receptors family 1 profile domain-containing protein n=1 Tax=Chytriomyces confervae TaxID=246404 RepID=A0A507EFZ8_9FUNG|nr:hypothetical protein CcCBS67573_g08810 [Chytriomyces confervae]